MQLPRRERASRRDVREVACFMNAMTRVMMAFGGLST